MGVCDPRLKAMIGALTARRLALGISADELAERCGFAEKQVTKWENGHRAPTAFLLTVWANSLGYELAVVPSTTHSPLLPLTADLFARRQSETGITSSFTSKKSARSAA